MQRRRRRFVFLLLAGVLGGFLGYVLLVAFIPGLMMLDLVGVLNLGLCLGALQFFSLLVATVAYLRWARATLDPMVERLRSQLEDGRVR